MSKKSRSLEVAAGSVVWEVVDNGVWGSAKKQDIIFTVLGLLREWEWG